MRKHCSRLFTEPMKSTDAINWLILPQESITRFYPSRVRYFVLCESIAPNEIVTGLATIAYGLHGLNEAIAGQGTVPCTKRLYATRPFHFCLLE
jgi:hypothetical protein